MTRKWVLGCLAIVLLLVLIVFLLFAAMAGAGFLIELPLSLFFGWVGFLRETVPKVQVDRVGVLTALLLLVGFAVGLHLFLRWLVPQVASESETDRKRWPVRASVAIVLVVVLMFVAGMATTGVAHQVGWLFASRGEWLQNSRVMDRMFSSDNLKQIGSATDKYAAASGEFRAISFDANGRPMHGWQTQLLPYLDAAALYNAINFQKPWDHAENAPAVRTKVREYLNPAVEESDDLNAEGQALSHYALNASLVKIKTLKEVTDGTSVTFLGGEVPTGFRPWANPVNWRDPALGINRSPAGFGSPHPGGANVLFLDGSVRFLHDRIDPKVLKALGTPSGGEPIPIDSN